MSDRRKGVLEQKETETESVIVKEWPANSRETLRITLDTFKGHSVIDLRKWFDGGAGELRPGKGLTVSTRHLTALAGALNEALAQARRQGRATGDGDDV